MKSEDPAADVAADVAYAIAEAGDVAIRQIARDLLEPIKLPDECPSLRERLRTAIATLVRERCEARTTAHDAIVDLQHLEREHEALRAKVERLQAVVRGVLVDHDQSIGPEEDREGEKRWWRLPATRAALDALEDGDMPPYIDEADDS